MDNLMFNLILFNQVKLMVFKRCFCYSTDNMVLFVCMATAKLSIRLMERADVSMVTGLVLTALPSRYHGTDTFTGKIRTSE